MKLNRYILSLLLAFGMGTAVLTLPTQQVHAQQPATSAVQVTVRVILANNTGAGVSHGLGPWTGRLRNQFRQYNTFSLYATQSFSVTVGGASQSINIPGTGSASLELSAHAQGQYVFDVQIPGGVTSVRSPAGSLFFVGGAAVPGGTLILMIET